MATTAARHIILLLFDDGDGAGLTDTWRGGLDLFVIVSSYATATVSYQCAAHTKIVLFPTLVKKPRLDLAGAHAILCLLAGSHHRGELRTRIKYNYPLIAFMSISNFGIAPIVCV